MRIAAFEFKHRVDVPYRVVLNEAIEVVKRFGSEHSHTYVNGVLDKLAGDWRSAEFKTSSCPAQSPPRRSSP